MSEHVHSIKPPHFTVGVDGELYGQDSPENRELVRRITACVNACEGISTEELEKGIIQDLRNVISDIVPLLEDKRDSIQQQVQMAKRNISMPNMMNKTMNTGLVSGPG